VYKNGIACSQGEDRRELLWNEVVEVTSDLIVAPSGEKSHAIAFEVVSQPPLLIVIGGAFGSNKEARGLLDALELVWVPVWCRRARVLLSDERSIVLGAAQLTVASVKMGASQLRWDEVKGVDMKAECETLSTDAGPIRFEPIAGPTPFPSAAKRVAALAKSPPTIPLFSPAVLQDSK